MSFNSGSFNNAAINGIANATPTIISNTNLAAGSTTTLELFIATTTTAASLTTTTWGADIFSTSLLEASTTTSLIVQTTIISNELAIADSFAGLDINSVSTSACGTGSTTYFLQDVETYSTAVASEITRSLGAAGVVTGTATTAASSSVTVETSIISTTGAKAASSVILGNVTAVSSTSLAAAGSTTSFISAASLLSTSSCASQSTTAMTGVAIVITTSQALTSSTWPVESISVWNLNAETGAAWSYTNYPFNSICDLGGVIIAAGSGGIYVVDQTTDAGSDIIAEAKSGLIDFNVPALKNILSVDVLGQFSSAPVIKMSETGSGTLNEWHYKSFYPSDSAYREHVIKTGRGIRSRYIGAAVQTRGQAVVEKINPQVVKLGTRH